jgi:Flp pilus assembly pilin Flp
MKLVQRFLKDESGATAIEYALVAHIISMFILAVGQFGRTVDPASTKVAAGVEK